MLLHNTYINMAIANSLLYPKSPQDLRGLNCKNMTCRKSLKRAWPKNGCCRPNQNRRQLKFHCQGSQVVDSGLKTKSADKANDSKHGDSSNPTNVPYSKHEEGLKGFEIIIITRTDYRIQKTSLFKMVAMPQHGDLHFALSSLQYHRNCLFLKYCHL